MSDEAMEILGALFDEGINFADYDEGKRASNALGLTTSTWRRMGETEAEQQIAAYEATHGKLPAYVRDAMHAKLTAGEPVPPLPGELGFRESDWL